MGSTSRAQLNQTLTKGVFALRKTILALALVLVFGGIALADVTYQEETKMGGMMGKMMGGNQKSTTRISGSHMRTDNDSQSTIVDVDGEKIYTLDNKKKTYSVMTFQEMREKLESAMESMKAKKAEAGQEGGEMTTSANAKVTETGRTEEIGGHECKQYLLELEMTMSNEQGQSGMSTVSEMWQARDVPGIDEIHAFYRKMGAKLGSMAIGGPMFSGKNQSQFGESMQQMAEEMKKIDGFTMRSVMYIGDAEAAKKEAMGEKPEGDQGGGGLGGFLNKMKNPMGGGGGVMMRITTETQKIEVKDIDPSVFAVPDNYKLVEAR
jgi:hypothetical protein